jgi:hypothetical protein
MLFASTIAIGAMGSVTVTFLPKMAVKVRAAVKLGKKMIHQKVNFRVDTFNMWYSWAGLKSTFGRFSMIPL